MTASSTFRKFLPTASAWEKTLDQYSPQEFARKPAEDSWSIGQVYAHLVNGTFRYHIRQIEQCLAGDEHAGESKAMPGRIAMFIDGFPPVRIKVPPSDTYTPRQPENQATVKADLQKLQVRLEELATLIDNSSAKGKTQHPAFGYLNAKEWFRLIEMHFRHHLRQKARIDRFLKAQNTAAHA